MKAEFQSRTFSNLLRFAVLFSILLAVGDFAIAAEPYSINSDRPQNSVVVAQADTDETAKKEETPYEQTPQQRSPDENPPQKKQQDGSQSQSSYWELAKSVAFVVLPALLGAFIVYVALRTKKIRTNVISTDTMSPTPAVDLPERDIDAQQLANEQIAKMFSSTSKGSAPLLEVESVSIKNFKNLEHLQLDLSVASELDGNWTCIAGINGAGKSSILQATCLLLLGERRVPELGLTQLRRFLRRTVSKKLDSELRASVRVGGSDPFALCIPLTRDGLDQQRLYTDPAYPMMRAFWEQMEHTMFLSYGATRNLSEAEDLRYESRGPQVRRQMTLFDPLTRVSGVDVLLKSTKASKRKLETLYKLLMKVVGDGELPVEMSSTGDRVVFEQTGVKVDAVDLPDGFRSTVAWLADLCTAWHDTAPEGISRSTDPADMTGIVLLDEIGLHLHPSLARSIVPQLRKALPKVQFIVTTHSPLVLSSFDRAELIVLETNDEGRVVERKLDRQVFGFTTDEVYKWLMNTQPQSTVLEIKAQEGDDPRFAEYLYHSEDVDEKEAKKLVNDIKSLLRDTKDYPES